VIAIQLGENRNRTNGISLNEKDEMVSNVKTQMSLQVAEIFKSIQGESLFSGLPCSFVRLSGCNLRCGYCDSKWAWNSGTEMSIVEITKKLHNFGCALVEITGGEPLTQKNSIPLMKRLLKDGFTILLETNGTIPLNNVPANVVRIVDIKTPGSGMSEKNRYENLKTLTFRDEVKFVVTNEKDYKWSKQMIDKYKLTVKTRISISPAGNKKFAALLASWMIRDSIAARLNLQLHKILWPRAVKGV
jgi:7-carboxy-7-deazaguanine synthase